MARTEDAPAGIKGISVFIVPKFIPNEDGSLGPANDVRCLSIEKKLGIKASPTAVMQYGENGGAVGYLVGAENQGLDIMFGMMNHARLAVGLQGWASLTAPIKKREPMLLIGFKAPRWRRVLAHRLRITRCATAHHNESRNRGYASLMILGAASMDLAHDCDADDPRHPRQSAG